MNKNIKTYMYKFINLIKSNKNLMFFYLLLLFSGLCLIPNQQAKSEEIFLKCIGKYEINRGPLIKPDWETSYININLNGLISSVEDKGGIKKGRTKIRRNSYTITHRDNRNRIINIYSINGTYGTYMVKSPQRNRVLVGTCQKSRG